MPFSLHFNNSLTNGIALCPNLHRAFDRGLIAVDDDYRILLSSAFTENEKSPFSFGQLNGLALSLPANEQFYPSLEAFAWHRKHIFKQ